MSRRFFLYAAAVAIGAAGTASAQDELGADFTTLLPQLLSLPGADAIVVTARRREESALARVARSSDWAGRTVDALRAAAQETLPKAEFERLDCADARCEIDITVYETAPQDAVHAAQLWLSTAQSCAYRFTPIPGVDETRITATILCDE